MSKGKSQGAKVHEKDLLTHMTCVKTKHSLGQDRHKTDEFEDAFEELLNLVSKLERQLRKDKKQNPAKKWRLCATTRGRSYAVRRKKMLSCKQSRAYLVSCVNT
eukprot:6474240-Amphidinium_carterae.1